MAELSTQGLIQLYLYYNRETDGSFISPVELYSLDPIAKFYVIDPSIRPIPQGMSLFCALQSGNQSFTTEDVSHVYDPYDTTQPCTRFLAWTDPAPYTTPLYISKAGKSVYISFGKKLPSPQYKPISFSPIHVLTNPDVHIPRIRGNSPVNNFSVINDRPIFLFSNNSGRCLPDPSGVDLITCLHSSLQAKVQPSILSRLENNKKGSGITRVIFILGIIFGILFITIFFLSKV